MVNTEKRSKKKKRRVLRISRYIQSTSNLFTENKLLKVGLIVLLVMQADLHFSIKSQLENQRTVLVTPWGEQASVTGEAADQAYLRMMARYITSLKGTTSASSAGSQMAELLALVHPSVYDERKSEWAKVVKTLEKYPYVSHVASLRNNAEIEVISTKEKHTMKYLANSVRFVGKDAKPPRNVEYEVDYLVESGRFWLLDVRENVIDG